MRRPAWLLVGLSLALGIAAPPSSGATAVQGGLLVVGNRIVDATGQTVVLRGIHRDGTEGGPVQQPGEGGSRRDRLAGQRPPRVVARQRRTGYVDGARYYRETIAFLDQQTPQWGWIAFAFDGNTGGAFSLLSSTKTYPPNSTGRPVYDALRQQP